MEPPSSTNHFLRTGFTGDLGYELWVDPEQANALWDALLIAGRIVASVP